jgi:dihydrodipicolinate synthase/N-acetylneuraminate lyase
VTGIPARNVVIAAVATPVGSDYRPDGELLLARCHQVLAEGCDGITLFGTTGGAEFASPTGSDPGR